MNKIINLSCLSYGVSDEAFRIIEMVHLHITKKLKLFKMINKKSLAIFFK